MQSHTFPTVSDCQYFPSRRRTFRQISSTLGHFLFAYLLKLLKLSSPTCPSNFPIRPYPITWSNPLTPLNFVPSSPNLFQSIARTRFSRTSVPFWGLALTVFELLAAKIWPQIRVKWRHYFFEIYEDANLIVSSNSRRRKRYFELATSYSDAIFCGKSVAYAIVARIFWNRQFLHTKRNSFRATSRKWIDILS